MVELEAVFQSDEMRGSVLSFPAEIIERLFSGYNVKFKIAGAGTAEDRHEWERRAAKLRRTVADIQSLFVKLCSCRYAFM